MRLFFFCLLLLLATIGNARLVDISRVPSCLQPINAIKYAFAANQPGEIQTSFTETGIDKGLIFRLSDNGSGFQNNNSSKGTGFGTELVNLLVMELEGTLTADTSNGTTIIIHFKNKKPH